MLLVQHLRGRNIVVDRMHHHEFLIHFSALFTEVILCNQYKMFLCTVGRIIVNWPFHNQIYFRVESYNEDTLLMGDVLVSLKLCEVNGRDRIETRVNLQSSWSQNEFKSHYHY